LVTIGVTITALTGYIINAIEIILPQLLFLVVGVILMSSGAATFNHIIERKLDAQMLRTKNRPIASGRISVISGSIVGALFLILGFVILYFLSNPICALLGAFNAAWYLLVYTPLKRISVWAVFVGSITGVIPFFMGVFAAHPHQITSINYFVGAYLLMWQIPHFILLAYKYGEEYQRAGIANILSMVPELLVIRIYYVWMIACSLITLAFPFFGYLEHKFSVWILIGVALMVIILVVIGLLNSKNRINYKLSFMVTNLMQLALMLTLIGDKLI
jgi:protoheme IX farnesyltransferase